MIVVVLRDNSLILDDASYFRNVTYHVPFTPVTSSETLAALKTTRKCALNVEMMFIMMRQRSISGSGCKLLSSGSGNII